jgi:2'-5' RNA ligase
MRVFVAVALPDRVVEALETFLAPRRDAESAPSFSAAGSWHVTLAFVADAPARLIDPMVDGLAHLASTRTPLDLTLGGAGAFGSVPAARVLWLGARSEPADALPGLARAARTALRQAGAPVEGGPYVGHLTLGRWRQPLDATRWLRLMDTFEPARFTVEEFRLVQSHLRQGADGSSRYEVLARLPLSGATSSSDDG